MLRYEVLNLKVEMPSFKTIIHPVLILDKAVLSLLGFNYGTPESLAAAPIDGVLAATLLAAYICTRGWRAWRRAVEA